ncbi:MAG: redoxin domain-containing protein [Candidatus Omnitrophica bacterium]|nr:redoxin domain-containing protein [Candidatus Omnitrophota bacterium]
MRVSRVFLITGLLAVSMIRPGHAVPAVDFTATDTNGVQHKLSDFRGKYVVMEWFNPDCPFIRKHYDSGNMQALQKEAAAKGVVWLSVDSSAPGKQGYYPAEQHNLMMDAKNGAPAAIFIDADGDMGWAYGAKTTPHMFVIDPQGQLIYEGALDSISSADPNDIPNAENYVQKALSESMAGEPVSTPATRAYGCSVKY